MKLARRLTFGCLRGARREGLSPDVYRRLVAEIFRSLPGYLMLSVAGLIFGIYACASHPSLFWEATLVAMVIVSAARLILFRNFRRADRTGDLARPSITARYELAFALLAMSMSSLIGASVFQYARSERSQDIVCALILAMGIAGSISGRNGSRPRIAIAQIGVIIAPLMASFAAGSPAFRTVSCSLLFIFMVAIWLSIHAFYTSLTSSLINEARVGSLATRLRRTANLFEVALNNMTTGLIFFDTGKKVLIANEKMKDMLAPGVVDRMIGKTTYQFHEDLFDTLGLSPDEGSALRSEFNRIMEGRIEGRSTLTDHRRGRVFELRMMPVPDQGAVMNVDDVTEKILKEREIKRLAHYDNLTGLANRFTFEQELTRKLRADEGHDVVVCYLDLDRFKTINDEFGHHGGDQLLRIVASRIEGAKRPCDFAARLAGDEFALILDVERGRAEAGSVVAAVLNAISAGVSLGSSLVKVGASAGMVSGSDAFFDADIALRSADLALYEAKRSGGGKAFWYDRQMDTRERHLRSLTADLETALQRGQLKLVYQPIIDVRTGRMVSCEALTRWPHPALGSVSPGQFIPIAEQSGLILPLGRWALVQACRDIKAWGRDDLKVAVNISPLQLQQGSICDDVLKALKESGLQPERLELEITESAIASNPAAMRGALERLAAIGVGLALDDFGTGYSSLSLLHNLPVSKIKLDRSFVASIETDTSSVRLLASIVQMAQILKKQLVVEGVETQSELLAVLDAQARFVQGFYFSPPMPSADIAAFASRRDGSPAIDDTDRMINAS